MMAHKSRRRPASAVAAVLMVLASWAAPAGAHEEPIGEGGDDNLPPPSIEHPYVPEDAVYGGSRIFVRTDLINTTQFLRFRNQLAAIGFPDSVEAAPGSFLVSVGDYSLEEVQAKIETLEHTVDVVPAFGFAGRLSASETEDLEFGAWWAFSLFAIPCAAFALVLTRRRGAAD